MGKIKLRLLTISFLAMAFIFMTPSTLAYYSTVGKATNVVTSGDIQFIIHETYLTNPKVLFEHFPSFLLLYQDHL